MKTLADVLARERRCEDPALFVSEGPQRYNYHRLLTTAWKAANFLHHHGVREGTTVAVTPEHRAQPVLAFLGGSLLGARTRFVTGREADAKVLVAPYDKLDAFDLPAGTQRIGYGDDPTDPAHWYWEGDVWSENPTMPPEPSRPETEILVTDERGYSHADLLGWAQEARESLALAGDERVAVRARIVDARVLAAGVLAPLLAGSEILFPDDETAGDVAITFDTRDGEVHEEDVFDVASLDS
ncbi:hypothetical protein [Haloarchaeobius sp. TZWWS8]|uniref:hypothetical protein n=1 Tax=Haloarchaeobius sp. TZWWS8 TaxID=3446121 RepID=UPI003EBEABA9